MSAGRDSHDLSWPHPWQGEIELPPGKVPYVHGELRHCAGCGREFAAGHPKHTWCSPTCRERARAKVRSYGLKKCAHCGNDFRERYSDGHSVYCSKSCARWALAPALRKRVLLICVVCGKPFEVPFCHAPLRKRCSRACKAADQGLLRIASRTMAAQIRDDPRLRPPFTNARGGRRADLGNVYYRSAWEANTARYLERCRQQGELWSWAYESRRFDFPEGAAVYSYLPDFEIHTTPDAQPYFWEVKGRVRPADPLRMQEMSTHYPEVKVVIIDRAAYLRLHMAYKDIIPYWEDTH